MKVFSLVIVFLQALTIFSQQKEGRIDIIEDPAITRLVEKHIRVNDSLGTIPGYRIQLIFTSGVNGKKMAQEVEADFIKKFPDTKPYLIWDSPNYKVRVGDFRTRLDALKFQDEIKNNFPNGYLVQDQISIQ